jgi:hypothetical protein
MQEPVYIQQLTNAIRTVAEITLSNLNMDAKTLTVSGTPAQVSMAAWMFAAMDQPTPPNPATQEYRPAGSVNDVVSMLYLTHPQTPTSFQEIVNAMRMIPEMTQVFPYSPQNAVMIRGTDSQVAMTEWLFQQLNVPAGVQPVQSPAVHQYATPGVANDQVQVLFPTDSWNVLSLQQIANTLRVITQLTKVMQCNATGAVSVRGPTATVALAAWLFSQLDQAPPASAAAPQEFQMPGGADDVTQVVHLAPATTPESTVNIVKALRAAMKAPIFPDDIFNAVTLRGTADQIAAADALIKQMNQP